MVQKRGVAVVVDSSSCLPRQLIEEWSIYVVPHELIIEDRSFRDGTDMEPAEFYRLLEKNHASPTTSSPQPARFLDAFRSAGAVADNIVCITLSAKFSNTYEAALIAAREARSELRGCRIDVVDSRAAAGAQGLIALEAARMAQSGADAEQVTCRVEDLIPKVNLLAFLDTLHYLRKSGRVPWVAAWAGSMLGIRPLTELKLGEARVLEKPRSRARATDLLVNLMKDRVQNQPVQVNVMHADASADAEALSCRLEREFDCEELFVSEFTPVMGAHLGPGLLGLAFYTDS